LWKWHISVSAVRRKNQHVAVIFQQLDRAALQESRTVRGRLAQVQVTIRLRRGTENILAPLLHRRLPGPGIKSGVNFLKLAKNAAQGLTRRLTLASLVVRLVIFFTGSS
jgi:hypothetical protein